ncbi:MAG: 50S ribosomal protein L6 [Myxococcota bacterium]
MSRIGKKPVAIPDKVKVTVSGQKVVVEGPKGRLEHQAHPKTQVKVDGKQVVVTRVGEDRLAKGVYGLTRTLISNMVQGVSTGYERTVEINGVGFKAEVKGSVLNLALGFSHPVAFDLPKGITAEVDKLTKVTLRSADKQLLGTTVAKLRSLRPPEPYKGKGIKYAEEVIKRKEGKTGAG